MQFTNSREVNLKPYKALLWILFFFFVTFANKFDWDHFLAFSEVERRSWLLDLSPPLWSYQLCAGVTRLGDPQSFGLSLLFLPVLIFGSFWGLKILLLLGTFCGYFFLKRTLLLLDRKSAIPEEFVGWIALSLVFSNFFLWHFLIGNITFLLFYPAIGIFYFYVKTFQAELSRKELWTLAGLHWLIFTAGFYHVTVFFLLPLAMAILISTGWRLISAKNERGRRALLQFLAFSLLGFFLAAYKWIPVLLYQKANPRNVFFVGDWVSIPELFRALFLPTWNLKYLGLIMSEGPWPIWDFSAFSLPNVLFLFCGLYLLVRRIRAKKVRVAEPAVRSLRVFLWSGFLVSFVLYLGDRGPWSPFALLNNHVLASSSRNVSRFGWSLLIFSLMLVVNELHGSFPKLKKILAARTTLVLLYALTALNFASFASILQESPSLKGILELPRENGDSLAGIEYVIPRFNNFSFMYPAVLRNSMVADCYCPLNRNTSFASESYFPPAYKPGQVLPWIRGSEECVKHSSIRQNRLEIAPACREFCVALNHVRPADIERYKLKRRGRLLCSEP